MCKNRDLKKVGVVIMGWEFLFWGVKKGGKHLCRKAFPPNGEKLDGQRVNLIFFLDLKLVPQVTFVCDILFVE